MKESETRVRRTGVFVCECGDEIASRLDIPELTLALGRLENAPSVHVAKYWCSGAGLRRLRAVVEREGLDAVVVAGCSPRTHGALIAGAAAQAGVNRNRTVLANLREHCVRVHKGNRSRARSKALRLIRVGLQRVERARALEPISTRVNGSVVVIGGGITGMTVARALGARGIPVVLIEKDDQLGGILGSLNHLYPSYRDSALYVQDVARALTANENIEVLTGSRVLAVSGHVGEYTLTVRAGEDERELVAGAVVVATGCDVLVPDGLYDYGENPKVVAQLELERMLRGDLGGAKRFVMIQCVGSRNEERPYCSRVCCTATVKNTIAILDAVPDAEITVLSRGFAHYVGDLERARDAGVTFRRYDPERPPVVHADAVEVFDVLTASEVAIPYDLVVLATPLLARQETAELAGMLNLPVDQHGFVAEPHSKLRPNAFAPSGIFVAGSAHWPATVTECQSQAMSSASRAALLVGRALVEREPIVAVVDELTCRGCGECAEVCAHGAPVLSEGSDGLRLTSIDAVQCRGCGVCIRVCPSTAISLEHMTEEQLLSMVDAAAG